MGLTGLKNGLLADYSITFHFAFRKSSIVNMPMPAHQLDGKIALVFDGDAVSEDIVILTGTGIRRLIFRLHRYFYALGNFCYHQVKNIIFFYFTTEWKILFIEN